MTDLMEPYDAERQTVTPDELGAPVDSPHVRRTVHATVTGMRDRDLEPIVPAWLRNAQQRSEVARFAVRFVLWFLGKHAWLSPKYLSKVAIYAPVGIVRGAWRVFYWLFDLEAFSLRQAAVTANKHDEYMALSRQRDRRVAVRSRIVWPLVLVLAIGSALFAWLAPGWIQALVAMGAAMVFAWIGRPADRPIIDRVRQGQQFIKLTAEMTRAALIACGAGIKDATDLHFTSDIRREGPGWLALVNLPPGIVASDVIEKRERLAAGFRLPKMQVWPASVDGEHPGLLRVWVADKPVNAMKQPAWPLLAGGKTDYWKPFPYGFDEQLRPVMWRLDEKNSLFGGIPGSGKSLAARVVVLGAILDPLVIPVIFELKGTGDFDMIEPLCPPGLYGSGADEGTKQDAYRGLLWLLRQCDERGPLVKEWAKRLKTENKVTRDMAEREPRLRPIVAVFDEVQELFTDKEIGKGAVAAATSIIKRGRALGIHFLPATQRIDKESIPRGISSNIGIRLALACTSHIEVDLILGTGMHGRGARSTEFEPGPDSGWGYRTGLGKLQPVRAAYVNNAQAEAVTKRAIAMRKAAGFEAMPKVRIRSIGDDVRAVWPEGVTGWWLADILAALQALDDTYAEMDTETLSSALRAIGIIPVQVHRKIEGKGVTRYGLQLDKLPKADPVPEIED